MKFAFGIASLLCGTLVASNSLSAFGKEPQHALDEATKVPGDNPLEYCQAAHAADMVTIDHVNLTPNPPQAGQELIIEATGTALEDIEEGAYVILQVKLGLIRLINTKASLCDQVKNVDMECPIKKGEVTIRKIVEIPKEIPPGTYKVLADVYDKDDKHLVCLTASVAFARG